MSDTEKGAAARKKERPTKIEEKDQKKTDKKVKDKDKVKQEKEVKKKIQGQSTPKKLVVEDESAIANEISDMEKSILEGEKGLQEKKDKLDQLKRRQQKSQKLKAKEEEDTSTKSSTSQKHSKFANEPMRNKDVTELPGIGDIHGGELRKKRFTKAKHVLGQFLDLERTGGDFKEWLKETGANEKQREDCYRGIKDWCDHHL